MRAKQKTVHRLVFKFALVLEVCAFGFLTSGMVEAQSARKTKVPPTTFVQEKEAAKKEGIPVSAKELQAPLPPPKQNAALLYRQLGKLLTAKQLSATDREVQNSFGLWRLSAEQIAGMRRAFANRPGVLTLIHKAAARPNCVFQHDWTDPFAVIFPELARMRSAARWLSGESALLLYDGKPLEAARNQALGFRIARHAAFEPTLIAHLVAIAIDAITLKGLENILYEAGEKPGVADAIRQAIQQGWKPHSLAYAMRGEAGMQVVLLDLLRKEGPKSIGEALGSDAAQPAVARKLPQNKEALERLLNVSGTVMLHTMRKVVNAADRPFPEARVTLSRIIRQLDQRWQQKQGDPAYLLVALLFPLFPQSAAARRASDQARAEIVRSAVAVLAWKAKHGAFPTKLKEALSPVPTDPFDGKPLRYRREGNGFVVYSVGETGKFDGGTAKTAPKPTEAVFRYPMPDWMQKPAPSAR